MRHRARSKSWMLGTSSSVTLEEDCYTTNHWTCFLDRKPASACAALGCGNRNLGCTCLDAGSAGPFRPCRSLDGDSPSPVCWTDGPPYAVGFSRNKRLGAHALLAGFATVLPTSTAFLVQVILQGKVRGFAEWLTLLCVNPRFSIEALPAFQRGSRDRESVVFALR